MAQCDIQSLIDDASCSTCIPGGILAVVQTQLLCRIWQALDPMANCDLQTLLTSASCMACPPAGVLAIVQTQLLCEISSAIKGGISGVTGVDCDVVDPTAAPTNPCTLFYNSATGGLWMWNGSAWILMIAGG